MSLLSLFGRRCPSPAPPAPAAAGPLPAVGLVAGRGDYPLAVCRAARRAGVARLAVVALQDETDAAIRDLADSLDTVAVGQLRRTINAFLEQDVRRVIFAGQIKPGRLFSGFKPDLLALRLLWQLPERNAHSLFGAVAGAFEAAGITVLPASTFLEDWLAGEGVLGRLRPSSRQREEMTFGMRLAREVARLDIGQTVVVKRGTVLAVEGFEGTDKAIRRGGELGGGRVTVAKAAKPRHDMRFDIPCIGQRTVESLIAARAHGLAVQSGKTLFLNRDDTLAALDRAGIAVMGFPVTDA
ncbi:MAG: UDP-2,3-diacylglucosamine diphosphatase LpxI [Lentisphaeria bacterium]